MSSFPLDFSSHRTQLVLTALTASVLTSGLWSAYHLYNTRERREKRRELEDEARRSLAKAASSKLPVVPDAQEETILLNGFSSPSSSLPEALLTDPSNSYPDPLIREQLARNYAFFGEEGMAKIRRATIVVVGCGGVGSWAAVMLVRSGVSKIRLVDFDYISLSSLNRHATATLADVGMPKVECISRALKGFSKWVEVDARIEVWRGEDGGALLGGLSEGEGEIWVVDAIDNIKTKIDLLQYCHDHGLKVFSSMGAGAKSDPTRIQIADISQTVYDPLARSVRRGLRMRGVLSAPSNKAGTDNEANEGGGLDGEKMSKSGDDECLTRVPPTIPVVYSTEVPGDVRLLPLPEEEFQKGAVHELSAFDDWRVRILPVLGPIPAIFGLHIATYILCDLAGKPIANPLPIKNRRKLYERLLRDLLHREIKLVGHPINKLSIDEDDVSLIFEDIHRGRSVIPPHLVPSRPCLVRWDPSSPLMNENCVVMEHGEAERHVKECFATGKRPVEVWGEEVQAVIDRRRKEVKRHREWVM